MGCFCGPMQVLAGTQVSEKCDIFSLGVVLWEIVTGERPHLRQLRPLEYVLILHVPDISVTCAGSTFMHILHHGSVRSIFKVIWCSVSKVFRHILSCRVPEECPKEVDAIIQACRKVNPAERPTAKEVYDVIARCTSRQNSTVRH
jgi:serine/threonine protein kinase